MSSAAGEFKLFPPPPDCERQARDCQRPHPRQASRSTTGCPRGAQITLCLGWLILLVQCTNRRPFPPLTLPLFSAPSEPLGQLHPSGGPQARGGRTLGRLSGWMFAWAVLCNLGPFLSGLRSVAARWGRRGAFGKACLLFGGLCGAAWQCAALCHWRTQSHPHTVCRTHFCCRLPMETRRNAVQVQVHTNRARSLGAAAREPPEPTGRPNDNNNNKDYL